MSDIEVKNAWKHFGSFTAVRDVSFNVAAGSFLSLLGPSGCGKTTSLRLIAGFATLDSGEILIDGRRINEIPPWQRDLGVVFQHYALFPFLTVAKNVAFGLERRKLPRDEIRRRVTQALELVGLPQLESRYPRQLSGGQQQRVALARALVIEPQALLLDEPLSNLDAKLRAEMRFELKRIQRETGVTTIFVTHDQEEALTLSDNIAVMNHGSIVAYGTPKAIWQAPQTEFAADFLGVENLFPATYAGKNRVSITADKTSVDNKNKLELYIENSATLLQPGTQRVLGIRSTDVLISTQALSDMANVFPGIVRETNYRGTFITYQIETTFATRPVIVSSQVDSSGFIELQVGQQVYLQLPPQRLLLLEQDSNENHNEP